MSYVLYPIMENGGDKFIIDDEDKLKDRESEQAIV